jgi:hypothetical protein
MMADRVDLARCLLDAHAGRQPRDRSQVMSPRSPLCEVVLQRRPDQRLRRQHVVEPGRHDADDEVAVVIERDRLADDRAVGLETPFPEGIAQDHDAGAVEAIVRRSELAAGDRRDA